MARRTNASIFRQDGGLPQLDHGVQERAVESGVFRKSLTSDHEALGVATRLRQPEVMSDRSSASMLLDILLHYLDRRVHDDGFDELLDEAPRLIPQVSRLRSAVESVTARLHDLRDALFAGTPLVNFGQLLEALGSELCELLDRAEELWFDGHYIDIGVVD
jgi:hypothetical protein